MVDPQIWYLQDGKVQSQAGKVFQHQQGPLLVFPGQEEQVDNSCLCKYRYMRYYIFYQKLQQGGSDSIVYFLSGLQSDSQGFIDYTTVSSSGYKWEICGGPTYIGCHPTGYLGEPGWTPIGLPYRDQEVNNTSVPSPYYIYRTTQGNRSSLRTRVVCSYKCCNGTVGCGIEIPRSDAQDYFQSLIPLCVQDFYVSNLRQALNNDDPSYAVAAAIRGSEQCCVKRVKKFQKLHDCDSATVRVWSGMLLLHSDSCQPYCGECFESLQDRAKGDAVQLARKERCVYWILWTAEQRNCKPCFNQSDSDAPKWERVTNYQGIGDLILGKGAGWQPIKAHKEGLVRPTICIWDSAGLNIVGHRFYGWTYLQKQPLTQSDSNIKPPGPISPEHITNCCSQVRYSNVPGFISDSFNSNSIPKAELPCNYPSAEAMQYLQFQHDHFNVYYLKCTQLSDADPGKDPCYKTYTLSSDALDGMRLKWQPYQLGKTDYELFEGGWIKGRQFTHRRGDRSDASDKFFIVVQQHEQPPTTLHDLKERQPNIELSQLLGNTFVDTSTNMCLYYMQRYLYGCVCPTPIGDPPCISNCSSDSKVPYTGGQCTHYRIVGQFPDNDELQKRGACLNTWAKSTVQSTFSDEKTGPIGQYVYTFRINKPLACQYNPTNLPDPPGKTLWYAVAQVYPECDSNSYMSVVSKYKWKTRSMGLQYCDTKTLRDFKQGWKTSPGTSDSLLPVYAQNDDVWLYPGEACKIYYIKYLSTIVNAGYRSDSVTYCEPKEEQDYSDSTILDNVYIEWNDSCLPWKKAVTYYVAKVTPDCPRRDKYTWGYPVTKFLLDSDSVSFGWGISQRFPIQKGDLIQSPITGITPPEDLCQLYYFSPIEIKRVCSSDYVYRPSDNTEEEPPSMSDATGINWSDRCAGRKTYVQYAFKHVTIPCSDSITETGWSYAVDQGDTYDIVSKYVTGWYNGHISSFANKHPASSHNTGGYIVYDLSECLGTCMAVLRVARSCQGPPSSQQFPESFPPGIHIPGYTYPASCKAKTTYYIYCSAQVQPYCVNNTVVGRIGSITTGVSTDAIQTGFYSTPVPSASTKVSNPLPCTVYYIQVHAQDRCSEPQAPPSSICSMQQGTIINGIQWQSQCIQSGKWYQYKQIQHACSQNGAGGFIVSPSWTVARYTGSNWGSLASGFYNKLPQAGSSLDPVTNNRPKGCLIYYIYELGVVDICSVQPAADTSVVLNYSDYSNLVWPDCGVTFYNYWRIGWYKAVPKCNSTTGQTYSEITFDSYTLAKSSGSSLFIATKWRTDKNYALNNISPPDTKGACTLYYTDYNYVYYIGQRCKDPDVSSYSPPSGAGPADPGFNWGSCPGVTVNMVYAFKWYRIYVNCSNGTLITGVQDAGETYQTTTTLLSVTTGPKASKVYNASYVNPSNPGTLCQFYWLAAYAVARSCSSTPANPTVSGSPPSPNVNWGSACGIIESVVQTQNGSASASSGGVHYLWVTCSGATSSWFDGNIWHFTFSGSSLTATADVVTLSIAGCRATCDMGFDVGGTGSGERMYLDINSTATHTHPSGKVFTVHLK